jgi:4-hydroxybenzoate polyprenyltransferase
MKGWKNFLLLVRWWHELLAILPFLVLFLIIQYRLVQNNIYCDFSITSFALVCFCVQLLMAAGFIFNDIIDRKIDKVNKPERFIIENTISFGLALRYFVLITFLIIGISIYIIIFIFWEWLFFSVGVYFLSIIYSLYLKRMPLIGNVVIAGLASFIPIVLLFSLKQCLYLIQDAKIVALIYMYAIFPFSIIVPREISLDMEDIEGDKIGNCKTVPIVIGINRTKIVIVLMILSGITMSLFMIHKYSFLSIPYFIVDSLLFLYLYKFIKSKNKSEYKRSRNFLWLIMIFGLIAFAVMTII